MGSARLRAFGVLVFVVACSSGAETGAPSAFADGDGAAGAPAVKPAPTATEKPAEPAPVEPADPDWPTAPPLTEIELGGAAGSAGSPAAELGGTGGTGGTGGSVATGGASPTGGSGGTGGAASGGTSSGGTGGYSDTDVFGKLPSPIPRCEKRWTATYCGTDKPDEWRCLDGFARMLPFCERKAGLGGTAEWDPHVEVMCCPAECGTYGLGTTRCPWSAEQYR